MYNKRNAFFLLAVICSMLSLNFKATAEPAPKKYDIFLEAENFDASRGFNIQGEAAASGGGVANLWNLADPGETGYYAKWEFNVSADETYWLMMWFQDISKTITSPFWTRVDDQNWIYCSRDTIDRFESAYALDMCGYIIGQFHLAAGKHTLTIRVNERRTYEDKAYNLIIDSLAFSKANPKQAPVGSGSANGQSPWKLRGNVRMFSALSTEPEIYGNTNIEYSKDTTSVYIPLFINVRRAAYNLDFQNWRIDSYRNGINYRFGIGRLGDGKNGLQDEDDPLGLMRILSDHLKAVRTEMAKVYTDNTEHQFVGYLLNQRPNKEMYAIGISKHQKDNIQWRLMGIANYDSVGIHKNTNISFDANWKLPFANITWEEAGSVTGKKFWGDPFTKARYLEIGDWQTAFGDMNFSYLNISPDFNAPLAGSNRLNYLSDPRSLAVIYKGQKAYQLANSNIFSAADRLFTNNGKLQLIQDDANNYVYHLSQSVSTRTTQGDIFFGTEFYQPIGSEEKDQTSYMQLGLSHRPGSRYYTMNNLSLGLLSRPQDPYGGGYKPVVNCQMELQPFSSLRMESDLRSFIYAWGKEEVASQAYVEAEYKPSLAAIPFLKRFNGFSALYAVEINKKGGANSGVTSFGRITVPTKLIRATFVLFNRPEREKLIFDQQWRFNISDIGQIRFNYKMRADSLKNLTSTARKNAYVEYIAPTGTGHVSLRYGINGLNTIITRNYIPEEDWGRPWERYSERAQGSNTTVRMYQVEFQINF